MEIKGCVLPRRDGSRAVRWDSRHRETRVCMLVQRESHLDSGGAYPKKLVQNLNKLSH